MMKSIVNIIVLVGIVMLSVIQDKNNKYIAYFDNDNRVVAWGQLDSLSNKTDVWSYFGENSYALCYYKDNKLESNVFFMETDSVHSIYSSVPFKNNKLEGIGLKYFENGWPKAKDWFVDGWFTYGFDCNVDFSKSGVVYSWPPQEMHEGHYDSSFFFQMFEMDDTDEIVYFGEDSQKVKNIQFILIILLIVYNCILLLFDSVKRRNDHQ